jgi:hypothetical protein
MAEADSVDGGAGQFAADASEAPELDPFGPASCPPLELDDAAASPGGPASPTTPPDPELDPAPEPLDPEEELIAEPPDPDPEPPPPLAIAPLPPPSASRPQRG